MIKNNLQSGFTLLEALVAVSILMVAVAAPITIAQKGLSSAVYSKDQMIAAYLAQDAIEYLKNKRDEISINSDFDWLDLTLFSLCLNESSCEIDTISNSSDFSNDISAYSSGRYLKRDINGFYQYSSGDDTKFKREINIELQDVEENSNDKAVVTVNISWDADKILTVKTEIYNY